MAAATLSVYPEFAAVSDGRLTLGGCDAVELARQHGTPAYVVSEDDLRARAREFMAAMGDRGHVLYACKAFPAAAVLRVFAEEGLWCLVASGGELHLALAAGFEPGRIVMHGNAKSHDELAAAADAGIALVIVDSLIDVDRLEALGARQRVLIRVTPDVETDTHAAIATGHADAKFGLGLDHTAEAIDRIRASANLELAGLHIHVGSQIFDTAPFREGLDAIAPFGDFDVIDAGGGLGVAYTGEERTLSVDDYVAAKLEAVGPGPTVLIEPGRSLVATSTVTLYSVESVKHGATRTWVAVDGGMSDNLRPMLYDAVYEAAIADRMDADGEPVTIVGKHCESGDELLRDVRLPDPQPGDVLVVPMSGAYHHALANNYNQALRPPVVFVSGGESRVVLRRETYADLRARDVA
jgi:diaminopimelate decarboxylase